jgi:predicted amidohydrolase
MKKIVRVATTSLATLEAVSPPYNVGQPDPEETFSRAVTLLDAAGAQQADLVCLPETFKTAGLPSARSSQFAEPLDGPTIAGLSHRARRHGMNIVAGMLATVEGRTMNLAVLIGRDGKLLGTYAKKHPTEGEIKSGIVPGGQATVIETDIGRIGLAICFDLNWSALWADMKAQGADMVCWISAYEGGFPLQAQAFIHELPVISSVQSYHAKIIERSGRVLCATNRWGRLVSADIDLDKRWFHTDGQAEKIVAVQASYGDRARVETLGEEHMFSIERRDPTVDLDELVAAMGLVEYAHYIARCTNAQRSAMQPPAGASITQPMIEPVK